MKILLTGIAGFIGFHLAKELLELNGDTQIVGIDNLNNYYDRTLKVARLSELGLECVNLQPEMVIKSKRFNQLSFTIMDLRNASEIRGLFEANAFDHVINLAAQAGVRYSLTDPQVYIDNNISGFLNILEGCRYFPVKNLIYASSSSVYGMNTQMPFSEADRVDKPASLYAATKRMNEAMAYVYAHLFNIKAIGLRLFTVYGEWDRPDMALFSFTKKILTGMPIQLFNNGDMTRDFTYVKDIVKGIIRLLQYPPKEVPPCEIYNIGNHSPVILADFVRTLEEALGKKAIIEFLPMQLGDVPDTFASVKKLQQLTGFAPTTNLATGIKRFVSWYKWYYQI
jgi:UDP-glucuronate 4-epimerase